jgi:hypothetical protein
MEPIVNGLEQDYQDEITFIRLNADTDGNATFRHYNLLGHPGYVFLNPAGEVLWSGVGELPLDQIDEVLKSHILQID